MLEHHLTMTPDKKIKKPLALHYLLPDNFPDESPEKPLKWSLALSLCITFHCTQDVRSCNSSGFYLHEDIGFGRVPDYGRSSKAKFVSLEDEPVSRRAQFMDPLQEERGLTEIRV